MICSGKRAGRPHDSLPSPTGTPPRHTYSGVSVPSGRAEPDIQLARPVILFSETVCVVVKRILPRLGCSLRVNFP